MRLKAVICSLLLSCGSSLWAGEKPDLDALAREGTRLLSEYLRIDTSNPPGNEATAARFLGRVLRREDIPYRILESAPGRASLYARLRGSGEQPPLLLLQHMDVVPTMRDQWKVDPFSGVIREGAVWGRGALDMKGLGVVHLLSFIGLHRNREPLSRDVILLATADEEAGGGLGMAWLMDNHFDLFRDVGMVLAEGGSNLTQDGRPVYIGVEVAQKVPVWLRLRVAGRAGHGSVQQADSAPLRLVRALDRLAGYQGRLQVEPVVARYFRRIARYQPPVLQPLFLGVRRIVEERNSVAQFGPYYGSLLKSTVNLTVLRAGDAINAVPAEAVAELDCRLLPGQDVDAFIEELSRVIDDPAVRIDRLLALPTGQSPDHPELLRAIERALAATGLAAEVGPAVLAGFTDSAYFRAADIPAYGIMPFFTASGEDMGVHAHDERIGLDDFRQGLALFYRIVENLTRPVTAEPISTR